MLFVLVLNIFYIVANHLGFETVGSLGAYSGYSYLTRSNISFHHMQRLHIITLSPTIYLLTSAYLYAYKTSCILQTPIY